MNLSLGGALALLAAGLLAPVPTSSASPKVSPLFGDGMVLQRDKEIAVWGLADKNEKVSVSFGSARRSTQADERGRWLVRLPPQPASAIPASLTIEGNGTVIIRDVLVGEVWLCSGQSNIEWPLRLSTGGEREAASADDPSLRFFRVGKNMAREPAANVRGDWKRCTPENAPHFSGVCFFFARELRGALGIPVGIVDASWGGTPIESWMSPDMLRASGEGEAVARFWDKTVAEYPTRKAAYDVALAAWQKKAEEARVAGKTEPEGCPWRPAGPGLPEEPTTLWFGMIAPLAPYSARGFVWYQGESNVGRDREYGALFRTLVQGWRAAWNGPGSELPFLFVQLPNYDDADAGRDDWARLREQQASALSLPATAMAVSFDAGEAGNLHPRDKRDIGHRLALLARAKVYGESVVCSGPAFESDCFEDGCLLLRFACSGALKTYGGQPPVFLVAGEDRVFRPIRGTIEKDVVRLPCAGANKPSAVRYGWENAPDREKLLTDASGLPAAPFKTDDW